MSGSGSELLERIAAIEAAEQTRKSSVRARFQERFGHPRPPGLVGEEAGWWRAAEATDPADTAAADAAGSEAIGAYLVAHVTGRDELRAAYAAAPFCRWRLGWAVAGSDGTHRSAEAGLDRALACVTLRADGFDVRDLILGLDRLCLVALRRGADPFPAIAVAEARARDAAGLETPASRLLATYLAPDRQAALRASTGA